MKREKKRIALLYRGPQREGRDDFSSFVPMGLFNVLKSLLAAGYRVHLHNLSGTPRAALRDSLAAMRADAFLVSAFFGCHHEASLLAETAKKISPQMPVILGGPLSVLGVAILAQMPAIDFVIRGEGEESTVDLLDFLFAGGANPAAIPGVVFRTAAGPRQNPARLLADINRYFFLPSELLPHCAGVAPENFSVLISSRGCPFHCAFCSSTVLWQNRVRHHRVDLLVKYLRDLRKTFGALYFSLRDENFLVNRGHVEEFAGALNRAGLYYLWNAQGSPHLIDDCLAATLAEAGCDQIQMGIETITPRLLALLNKKGDPGRTIEAINVLRRHLIRPFGYFIYGMGESEAEGKESLAFIKKAGLLDAVASPLVLYPGTSLAEGTPPQRFFAAGELLLHSPDSRKKWQKKYEQAVALLHSRGGFTREELFREKKANPITSVARHFYHLDRGELPRAEKTLLAMTEASPNNPWAFELLARFYAETDAADKARAMTMALRRVLSSPEPRS
ncbi:radical SAM protein [Thiovibrio sp. JS02]